MLMRVRAAVCLSVVLAVPSLVRAATTSPGMITQAELVSRTQQLYDAMGSGDKKPWMDYYADDAMFYDEKGRSMDKKALVADIEPLPAGYTGVIKVVNPHVVFAPGVAALAYECDETETIFGQVLHARYHSVDTWMDRGGRWQIVMSQTMRYYEDPAAGYSDPKRFGDFVGTYELTPGTRRSVVRDGDDLYVERNSGAKTRLIPEAGDVFFRAGVEGRVVFHRDASGKVTALYDRRNNEDVVWKKVE